MRLTWLRGKGFKIEVEPRFLVAVATIARLFM